MKLYNKLKEHNLVEDFKDFSELVWMRAIKINDIKIDDPKYELKKEDTNIKVGIFSIESL